MNKKGFTIVELLGSMVILSLLMVMVVPNVVGLMSTSKNNVYIEDAKKMVNIAKAKLSCNKDLRPTSPGQCAIFGLAYLDNSEFSSPPNGGCYDVSSSFVVVKLDGTDHEYKYYVQLVELDEKKVSYGFKKPTLLQNINNDTLKELEDNSEPINHFPNLQEEFYENKIGDFSTWVEGCNGDATKGRIMVNNGPKVYKSYTEPDVGICSS